MEVVCTDFDYLTEKIERISVGFSVIRGNLGPWLWCYDNCLQTVNVLSQYDMSELVIKDGGFDVDVVASNDVNIYACSGDTLIASIALILVSAAPYSSV